MTAIKNLVVLVTILSNFKSATFSKGGVLRKRYLGASNQKSFLAKVVGHPPFRGTGSDKKWTFWPL